MAFFQPGHQTPLETPLQTPIHINILEHKYCIWRESEPEAHENSFQLQEILYWWQELSFDLLKASQSTLKIAKLRELR